MWSYFLLPFFLPLYTLRVQLGFLPTTVLELGILAIVLHWLVVRGAEGVQNVFTQIRPWMWVALAWITAGALGVVTATINGFDARAALGLFRAYFVEPLLVFAVGLDAVRTQAHRERLLRAFQIVVMALAGSAVFQIATGMGIPHPWDAAWPARRATGPFPFPNALALFVAPLVALAAARAIAAFPTVRGWDVATCIAGIIAILLAQSDGGLVAVAAAIFTALLFHTQFRLFALCVAGTGILAALFVTPLRTYVTQVLLMQDWSGMVRLTIWKETFTMLTHYPLFGAGLGAYPLAIAPFHAATWMEIFQYPHTILLNLSSELGIPGILAFIALCWAWFRRAAAPTIAVPVILALLIHGLVDVPYFKNDLAVAWWLLLLLTTTPPQEKR